MMQWLLALQWDAIIQIIIIDILLGGDNAIVIALACRNLPKHLRRRGVIWGAAGAIVLRVILISIAVALLGIPWLKLVGAALLLWIGVKLMLPDLDDGTQAQVDASNRFWTAVRTIVVADFVMSLDNVIAIAAAAESADPSQRTGLIIFGLLFSVPFIVLGSQLVLKLLDRFPFIVTLGGALLGWIAGGLMVTDPALRAALPMTPSVGYVASALGAVFVVSVAKAMGRSRRSVHPSTPHGT